MADTMTPEQRSRCMSAVKGKDTKPEMIVRKYLFSKGLRFRLHVRSLPGNPDIVLPKYKTVVFINGCFWHGHEGCKYSHMPKSNVEFWENKIIANLSRDEANEIKLKQMGWQVIRVWECEIKKVQDRTKTLEKLYNRLKGISSYGFSRGDEMMLAAEGGVDYRKYTIFKKTIN